MDIGVHLAHPERIPEGIPLPARASSRLPRTQIQEQTEGPVTVDLGKSPDALPAGGTFLADDGTRTETRIDVAIRGRSPDQPFDFQIGPGRPEQRPEGIFQTRPGKDNPNLPDSATWICSVTSRYGQARSAALAKVRSSRGTTRTLSTSARANPRGSVGLGFRATHGTYDSIKAPTASLATTRKGPLQNDPGHRRQQDERRKMIAAPVGFHSNMALGRADIRMTGPVEARRQR